jgi:D-alanyl-D-alanine carboxypeptidase (penicillin-binding protein 5/6)
VTRRLAVLAAILVLPAAAQAAVPKVDARAYLVENGDNGEVLARYAIHRPLAVASLTKLMTVLITLERTRLDDVVTVSPEAAAVGESSAHLRAGERLTVRELLEAALIQSANDAADALASYVGHGSETAFVRLMNAHARALHLRDTHFARPDGLDAPGHVSSAHDVTVLARLVMRNPAVRAIVRRRTATISGGHTLHTWNDLLYSFPGLIGVKTGHTSEAGWSEVAAARRRGVTIYATVIGSPDRTTRNTAVATLLGWGLAHYRPLQLVPAGRIYTRVKTEYGRGSFALVPERPLVGVARIDRPLVERVLAPERATLPVARGQRFGWVRISQDGYPVGQRALVAARSVSTPNVAGRISWYAKRTVAHVAGWFS